MPTAFCVCMRLLFLPIFCPYGTFKKRHGNTKGWRGMAGIGKAFWPFRVRLFHHCASVPPRFWARHDYTGIRTPMGLGGRWSLWADVVPRGKVDGLYAPLSACSRTTTGRVLPTRTIRRTRGTWTWTMATWTTTIRPTRTMYGRFAQENDGPAALINGWSSVGWVEARNPTEYRMPRATNGWSWVSRHSTQPTYRPSQMNWYHF